MSGVNKVILLGNLGKDPDIRNLESGAKVATFSLATNETYKDRTTGEQRENTEWHNIVCWRGLADVAEKYLKKGSQIYIEGKLRTRSWESQEGGTRYTTEVVADTFTMLGKPGSGNSMTPPPPTGEDYSRQSTMSQPGKVQETAPNEPDDLPF